MIDATKLTASQRSALDQRLQALARSVAVAGLAAQPSSEMPGPAQLRQPWALDEADFDELVSAARRCSRDEISGLDLGAMAAQSERLDQHAARYVARWLDDNACFGPGEVVWSASALADRLGVVPGYLRAWQRLLNVAARAGYLQHRGEGFVLAPDPWSRVPAPAVLGDAAIEQFLSRSGQRLGDILCGRIYAAEALFADGQVDLAVRLYTDTPPFRYCNAITAAVLQTLADRRPAGSGLQGLEIGAGTGGTTRSLMALLQAHFDVYWFTDVSGFFFESFRNSAKPPAVLRYAELDIEAPAAFEALGTGPFNVVVCAHVLHATRDVAATLAHVRRLIRPGGLMCLLEEVEFHPFFSITMGLQTGFDRFQDMPLRSEHPLLTAGQWSAQLLAAGFARVEALPSVGGICPLLVLG